MANRICSIPDCEKAAHCRGWCSMHYQRWRTTGSPDRGCRTCAEPLLGFGQAAYCSDGCRPRCDVTGCEGAARKMGWCASHYQQSRATGLPPVPFKHKWSEAGQPCVTCGGPVESGTGRRRHCSDACRVAESWHKGKATRRPGTAPGRAPTAECILCGGTFSLGRRSDGRLQRTDTKWCRDCGRNSPAANRFKRHGVTPERYAAAMLKGCEICGTKTQLHIDHDHKCCPPGRFRKCGECVRGFLCGGCNRALGMLRDDPDVVAKAANYLRSWSAV